MNSIRDFFAGRTVLITGSTGFLGKAVLEKVLRSLPEVKRIYLLIRSRQRGAEQRDAQQRLDREVLASTIFDRLRREVGEGWAALVDERLVALDGDLYQPWMGLGRECAEALAPELDVRYVR